MEQPERPASLPDTLMVAGYVRPGDAEFLRTAVEKLREKLIDISKRSPLISFKHAERGATYLRIIDETLDGLFTGLSGSASMGFEPLPDPNQEPADQKTPDFKLALESARLTDPDYRSALNRADAETFEAAERALVAKVRDAQGLPRLAVGRTPDLDGLARANGVNPELELPAQAAGAHHSDRKIRVLMLPDKLEGRLRTMFDRYRGHAAETGIHTLQLALGFLEWREADASDVAHQAPLLTLAVDLKREMKGGQARYVLTGRDEPLSVNMALQEMLRRYHNVALPEIAEGDTPEAWLARAAKVIGGAKGLSLRRWATLAVLPFPNMAVWRDLDTSAGGWPELLEHPEIGVLLGGREADSVEGAGDLGFPPDYPIDQWTAAEIPPLVLDADVSQHSALADTAEGLSLALEGPPGTGKSQTIANMIAGTLSKNRRVLFVAEKRAALEVVAERLKALGLGDLLLELHSDKATKAEVLGSIQRALNAKAVATDAVESCVSEREALLRRRDVLRRYHALLRQPVGALAQPAGDLVWREMRLRAMISPVLPRPVWDRVVPDAEQVAPYQLSQARAVLDSVGAVATAIREQGRETSPWGAAARLPTNPIGQQQALDHLAAVVEATRGLGAWREKIAAELGAAPERLDQALAWTKPLAAAPAPSGVPARVLKAALADPAAVQSLARSLKAREERQATLTRAHARPLEASATAVAEAVAAARAALSVATTLADLALALNSAEAALSKLLD